MIATAAAAPGRMRLVALVGGDGSGRRTLARHIARVHGFERVSLEWPLRRAVCEVFGVPRGAFESAAAANAVCGPQGCTSPRALVHCLREAGGGFRGSDAFLAKLAESDLRLRLRRGASLVVEDVATRTEAEVLLRLGGELWRVGDSAPEWLRGLEHVALCTDQPVQHTCDDADLLLLMC